MGTRAVGQFASMERLQDRVRSTFWVVPAACVLASIVLAWGLVAVDSAVGTAVGASILYPGPPAGARSLLSSIVTAMISFTGLVFSITVVVLQLTSGQFSPRVLRIFLRDRTVRYSLGIFIATFVYALVVQRSVLGTTGHAPFVPRIAVSMAFIFVLASVGLFIGYLARISDMIRVATIVTEIGGEARGTLERYYRPAMDDAGPSAGPSSGAGWVVRAPTGGVLVSVNETRLVKAAVDSDCVLALTVRIGDFVPAGAPLCVVRSRDDTVRFEDRKKCAIEGEILAHIAQDSERTSEQDLAFSFRQLVDIAERALSPSVNDPTTACQCIDVLHDLLRRLSGRQLPSGRWAADDLQAGAVVRLSVPQYSYADFLDLAVGEIWHYGSDAAQVPGRLAAMLADLGEAALPAYRTDLHRWAARIGPAPGGQARSHGQTGPQHP